MSSFLLYSCYLCDVIKFNVNVCPLTFHDIKICTHIHTYGAFHKTHTISQAVCFHLAAWFSFVFIYGVYHHAEGTPVEAENGIQGVKVNSHVTPAQISGTVWFLPENLAGLWFPEVSYTCTVASNPCSHTLYCMNPRTAHDYVPSWRKGHRLPCCGELCLKKLSILRGILYPGHPTCLEGQPFWGTSWPSATLSLGSTCHAPRVGCPYFTLSLVHFHLSSAALTTVVSSCVGQELAAQSLKPSGRMVLAYLSQGPKHVCCLATIRRSTARRCGNCFQDQACQCGKKIINPR